MFIKLTVVIISWCKSNHYAVHFKLIQYCMSIISKYNCKKETLKKKEENKGSTLFDTGLNIFFGYASSGKGT